MKKIGNIDKVMADMGALIGATIKEDEFTINDFIEKYNIPSRTARSLLEKQVKLGVLNSRKVLINRNYHNAYSYNKK